MCNNCSCKNDQSKNGCANSSEVRNLIGFIHTKVMEKVGAYEGFPNIESQTHYRLVVDETRRLLTRAGYTGLVFPGFDAEFVVVSRIKNTKPATLIAELVNEGTVSQQGGQILEEVLAILKSGQPREFQVNALEELYGYVQGSVSFPSKEQNALLVGLRIGVASVNFWARVRTDNHSPYYRIAINWSPLNAPLPWGDICGGTANCILCSETGPVGCIGCASVSSGWASSLFESAA